MEKSSVRTSGKSADNRGGLCIELHEWFSSWRFKSSLVRQEIRNFDTHLTSIENRLVFIENTNRQVQKDIVDLKETIRETEGHVQKVQKSLGILEESFDQPDEEFEELQSIVENIDNLFQKNNIKLLRLKKGVEVII